jgi:hypothetical protein
MFDGAAFGKEMVGIVRGYVDKVVAPLVKRLDAIESREPVKGLDGKDGRDGVDGKDADPAAIADLVREEVEKAVAALPKPQDGKSVTAEDLAPLISKSVEAAVSGAVKAIPVPKDGKDGASVTVEDVAPLVDEAVTRAVSAIPVPEDGRDGVDGKDGRDGRDGLDAVTPILKDGVLLFTMSDGSVKEVGRVQGKDGADGAHGRDGIDGLGFDDMSAEYDGERGITFRFERGETVKEFKFSLPVIIDRGVWVEAKEGGYAKGDGVTWAGSFWISQKDENGDKPDGGDGWRLSVKRGRDGKPGKDGEMKTREPVKVG